MSALIKEIAVTVEYANTEWSSEDQVIHINNAMHLVNRIAELEAENARLLTLVKEWACDTCMMVYPGPPQEGTACIKCPKCGGRTMPHETLKWRQAEQEVARLNQSALRLAQDNTRLEGHIRAIAKYHDFQRSMAVSSFFDQQHHAERRDFALSGLKS